MDACIQLCWLDRRNYFQWSDARSEKLFIRNKIEFWCSGNIAEDGQWGEWAPWGRCSPSCMETRHRNCDSPKPKGSLNWRNSFNCHWFTKMVTTAMKLVWFIFQSKGFFRMVAENVMSFVEWICRSEAAPKDHVKVRELQRYLQQLLFLSTPVRNAVRKTNCNNYKSFSSYSIYIFN